MAFGSSGSPGFGEKRWILFSLLVCGLVGLCIVTYYPRQWELNGLLVDLELEGPDSSRYGRIRDVFTKRLPAESRRLSNCRLRLEYVHFTDLHEDRLDPARIDFLILSPQGTPWSQYEGPAGDALNQLVVLLNNAVHKDSIPVLGICGGHQFLALAFGGTVGFIDPAFASRKLERYLPEAKAERGVVLLKTVKSDPILEGVSKHPGQFSVIESHYEEVKALPNGFVNLARSEMSPIQLMRLPGKVVYGTAFHPERCWDDGECSEKGLSSGRRLLVNFLVMASED